MILGWDLTKPPDPPKAVGVDVTSTNSVNVRIQESPDGALTTKFKGTVHIERARARSVLTIAKSGCLYAGSLQLCIERN